MTHEITRVHISGSPNDKHCAPGPGWECSCGAASYGWDSDQDRDRSAEQHARDAAVISAWLANPFPQEPA